MVMLRCDCAPDNVCDYCRAEEFKKERDRALAEVERLKAGYENARRDFDRCAETQRAAFSDAAKAEADAARLREALEKCVEAMDSADYFRTLALHATTADLCKAAIDHARKALKGGG